MENIKNINEMSIEEIKNTFMEGNYEFWSDLGYTTLQQKEIFDVVRDNKLTESQVRFFLSLSPDYTFYQMDEVKLGLYTLSIDQIKLYTKLEYNREQMREIRLGLENGIDISEYAYTDIPSMEMRKIRTSLYFQKIQNMSLEEIQHLPISTLINLGYTVDQAHEIQKIDKYKLSEAQFKYSFNPIFDASQMIELKKGMEHNIHIFVYDNPLLSSKEMKDLRCLLVDEQIENLTLKDIKTLDLNDIYFNNCCSKQKLSYLVDKANEENLQFIRVALSNKYNEINHFDELDVSPVATKIMREYIEHNKGIPYYYENNINEKNTKAEQENISYKYATCEDAR